jgi:hypothetical protein
MHFHVLSPPFRASIVVVILFFCSGNIWGQTDGGLPYNPDSDNSGTIEVNDLLVFLPYYGESFLPEGIMPIEFGGTGASSSAAARDSLGLSSIKDSLWGAPPTAWTWANGSLRILKQFSQGYNTVATGTYAHASGTNTSATGAYSHAQNRQSSATATCASAEGEGTTASGTASHAEGMLSSASGLAAHGEGYNTVAASNYSHSEGYGTTAANTAAHAEGFLTDALGLYGHAEGRQTEAGGTASHAEGQSSLALGDVSHAEGFQTIASGYASHAAGYQSVASGLYSRALGRSTSASGTAASAFGHETIADQEDELVGGRFNASGEEGVLFAIGNGSSDSMRSNAFDVHEDGTIRLNGDAIVSGEVWIGGSAVSALIDSLLNTVNTLESSILDLQNQIDILNSGE